MSTINQTPDTSSRREKKIRWTHMLLALLFFVSSFMAGVMVGRSNEEHTVKGGTIFLSAAASEAVPINVYGRVVDGAGGVCPNMTVEWHSEPRYTTTDEDGNFHFDNIELGGHVVTVLDEDGKALAHAELEINRDIMVEGLALNRGGSGGYELQLSAQVIDIDVMMFLDEQKGTLELLADPSYSKTNMENLAIKQEPEGGREFGGGRFEGEPFRNRYISNGGVIPPAASEGAPDPSPQPDENSPSGNKNRPTTGGGKDEQMPDTMATPVPSQTVVPEPTAEPSIPVAPSETPTPTSSTSPTPSVPPPPKPTHGGGDRERDITISSQDGEEKKRWSADTRIDLFGKGTKLQPGSRGSYSFNVTNPNSFDIRFQIWMEDSPGENLDDTTIPLRYRLKLGEEYVAGDEDVWLDSAEIKANWAALPKRKTLTYILEWSWPYEDSKAGDQVDALLGATHDRPHLIKICTYFERTEGSN